MVELQVPVLSHRALSWGWMRDCFSVYSSLFGPDNPPQLKPQLFLYVLGYSNQYLYGQSLLSHLNSCHLLLHGKSKEKMNY